MKTKTHREQKEWEEVKTLIIVTKLGSEIRISENKFGEIVINKQHDEDSRIKIIPQYSNEIIIQ